MTVDHHTFCRVCNAMCGLVVTTDGDRIVRVRGDDAHPLSRGYSCPKGRAIGELHHAARRLDHPQVGRDEARRRWSWDDTLDDLAARLDVVRTTVGPDGIAMFLASGSAFDAAGRRAAERFLRLVGSRQKYTATTIDTPCRPLVAESMGGWSGLTPLWDEEAASLLLLVGSNPVVSHGHSNAMPDPVRRLRGFRSRGGELVVVDPRGTETAALADSHLAIRPGTDWLLLAWLVRDRLGDHPGADDLRVALTPLTLDVVARHTDLPAESITALADTIRRHGRINALTGTGSSMSARADVAEYLLWVLLAITDSFDAPGGMWFNPGLLSRLDERDLPAGDGRPGPGPPSAPHLPRRFDEWPCVGLLHEIESGNVRALLVVGGNPALAFPDTARTRRALASLETLAVLDIVPTATTALATHVLPATDQLERADTTWLLDTYQLAVAGQYTEAVVAPRAERRPVWWILGSVAERLGLDLLGAPVDSLSDSGLLASVVRRGRCDPETFVAASSGVVVSGPVHGWVTQRVLPGGRWRLEPPELLSALRLALDALDHHDVEADRSLRLVVHRRMRMMNSQLEHLTDGTDDEAGIRVHPDVASTIGGAGAPAVVHTEHGSVSGPIVVDPRLRPDTVTIGHGSETCDVSRLTSAVDGIDPLTGMVEQSALRCRLEPDA